MSHLVQIDDVVRRHLVELDVELATAKSESVVDINVIAEMKRRRKEMIAFLARAETAIST